MKMKVVYLSQDLQDAEDFKLKYSPVLEVHHFDNPSQFLNWTDKNDDVDAIIFNVNPASTLGLNLVKILKLERQLSTAIIWLSPTTFSPQLKALMIKAGVTEIIYQDADKESLLTRLTYLTQPGTIALRENSPELTYKKIISKRVFDVLVSGFALLCLSPFFLLIALLIKLESKGPAFYYSYRVGTGYKIFKFWKFRSMRQDADKMVSALKGLNQYQASAEEPSAHQLNSLCADCKAAGSSCQFRLYDAQGQPICEKQYQSYKKAKNDAAFFKVANDPRITRIGMILRNTSIDELPQLYNVFRGDMSIVGNRPLPLYEAEKITTDQFAARFIAPAGITGLWQVSKRGKAGDMSEEERKALDIEYAKNFSLKKDLQILFKTIPALFQKENV